MARLSVPRRWFLGFCVAHVALGALLVVPGYLCIDEAIYHWMALEVPHNGELELQTGYREFPSPECTQSFLPVHNGRTAPQYPYLFPVLAAPSVRAFGFTGLILLNFAAFPVLLWLTWRLARTLFAGERAAWVACGFLLLGGYSWEYSLAAWPQVTSMALGVAGLFFGARTFTAPDQRTRSRWAFLAGIALGFNLGFRIDTVTLPATLLLLFAFARPWRAREAATLVLGCLPGLALLAVTNQVKFGTISPFSYGTESDTKLAPLPPLMVPLFVAALAAVWCLTRDRLWTWTCRHRRALTVAAILLVVILLGVTEARGVAVRLAKNAWYKFVDTSACDRSVSRAALRRTPEGGMVYLESLKQAWLQGMPWLAVLVAPVLALVSRHLREKLTGAQSQHKPAPSAGVHGRREGSPSPAAAIGLLLLPVFTLGGVMALVKFDGGLSLNQRYLLPLLPLVSLLGGWTLDRLAAAGVPPPRPALAGGLAALTATAFWLLVQRVLPRADQQFFVLLRWPLVVAGVIALGTLLVLFAPGRVRRVAGLALGPALVVAVTWSFAVSFLYDLPRHRLQRISNFEVARVVKPLVPSGSAFFSAPYVDPFHALIEVPGTRLLFPDRDRFRDFATLVDFHLRAGRPVYGVFRLADWRRLMEGPLAGRSSIPVYTFEERFEHGPVLLPRGPGLVPPLDPKLTFILATLKAGG